MGRTITVHRGYDIKLVGAARKSITEIPVSDVIAVKPPDFPKVKARIKVTPGDIVRAGQCLFTDKNRPELNFTSPVSGEVAEIVLGPKRRPLEIRILPDKSNPEYLSFPDSDPSSLSRDALIRLLIDSGCWNYIRQRPYDIIADPNTQPKAIFVSLFDTSPLAPDLDFIIEQEKENFETGLKALNTLAHGQVHLGKKHSGHNGQTHRSAFDVDEKNIHHFKGPHPAGNVGIHIHHVSPIQKGERVWYVHAQDVIIIGRLFREGRYRADRIIALTGSAVDQPGYCRVITGQRIKEIVAGKIKDSHSRIIQGNVLFGQASTENDYISFYTNQVTILPEGDKPEFLGWLLPGFNKLSLSRTFFSWLTPKRTYALDTNLHGEERAFVMTGQYDRVLPMNILPVFLLKAILAKDIEKMEQLGMYEVSEEDFALCEFVCTSKIDVQRIIREGLDMMMLEE